MGNDISVSITPTPLSLSNMLIDGELDLAHYYIYKRKVQMKEFQTHRLSEMLVPLVSI